MSDLSTIDPYMDLSGIGDDQDLMSIELPDGSVEISFGDPDEAHEEEAPRSKHDDNLAEALPQSELDHIAGELLEGIDDDDNSRSEWLERNAGYMDLLGLGASKKSPGAGPEGMSTIHHPLMLEAVLRFQANARSELLPTDGPVKIRDDDTNPIPNELIDAYEMDFNHYLTAVATEYVPDTDKMLFALGVYGSAFKKVYHDPIKRRPVSIMVDPKDLIISNATVDLMSAPRITHVIRMGRTLMRRMQIVGAYLDIDLDDPDEASSNPASDATRDISGVSPPQRPEDREHEIYECYCELDIPGYNHKDENRTVTGLPLPYKVSIDKTSGKILEIRRNWREGDEEQQRKRVFVHFLYTTGMGFYGIGLGQILDNTTRAATATWRMLLDAGQFANFPGGLVDKRAVRQNDSNFQVSPGTFKPIETSGGRVSDMFSPFPYKEPSPGLMALGQDIVQTASRVGGTAEMSVGEGRQDAPVGTTLALIEQATKIGDAVHKRIHAAQQVEFELLAELFREDPEAFWRFNRRPMLPWDKDALLYALDNCDLVPAADPNTSSHLQRMGKVQFVVGLAAQAPTLFNLPEVAQSALSMAHIPNYQQLLNPNPPNGGLPPPKGQGAAQDPARGQAMMMDAQTRRLSAMAKIKADMDRNKIAAVMAQAKVRSPDDQSSALAAHMDMFEAETRRMDAETRAHALSVKHADTLIDNANQAADRKSENDIAALDAHKDLAMHAATLGDNQAAREAEAEASRLAAARQ